MSPYADSLGVSECGEVRRGLPDAEAHHDKTDSHPAGEPEGDDRFEGHDASLLGTESPCVVVMEDS